MKKIENKKCKHEWYYSNTVKFGDEKEVFKVHFQIIHHCKKCGELDIQTIYS